MDPFVQSLHSRLEESNRQAMRMFETFIDRSLDEMEAKGYFSDLDPSLQAKVDSENFDESIDIKVALAKEMAHHTFVKGSYAISMPDGESARVVQVKVDPDFLNCLTLCVQGSLEGLFLTGATRRNKSGKMYYFIENDAPKSAWETLESKMDALAYLYPQFHIILLPGLKA